MTDAEFTKLLNSRRELVENCLYEWLPHTGDDSEQTAEAMRYAVTAGGKRLRPIIMLEVYSLSGRDEREILPFAAALEYIHSYSLVHDDMPCMDNSDLRRGKPSVHKKYGEWQALLAGDGLLNYAFETVCSHMDFNAVDPKTAVKCLGELSVASGIFGMVGGQSLDLSAESKSLTVSELEVLQSKKTGALIRAAGRIGAVASERDGEFVELITGYCDALGLAFQITDDILDCCGDSAQLGKPTGGDEKSSKNTFISLTGLEQSRRRAELLTETCRDAAEKLGSDFLAKLAVQMLTRQC